MMRKSSRTSESFYLFCIFLWTKQLVNFVGINLVLRLNRVGIDRSGRLEVAVACAGRNGHVGDFRLNDDRAPARFHWSLSAIRLK